MNELLLPIKNEIITAIEKDQITLPTLPEVALQVREAAADPDIDVHKLSAVITNDAVNASSNIRYYR